MKELLSYIVEHIVSHPEDIQIEMEETEGGFINLHLQVNPEDMGIVIGKGGNIIRAIRNLLRVKAIKENKRVNLELIESAVNTTSTTSEEPENDQ